jgi:hypothetical protein
MENQVILVPLDAIFDTHLGAVAQLDQMAAVKVLQSGYWEREDIDYETRSGGLITNEQWREQYAKRTKETIKASFPTEMLYFLRGVTLNLQDRQTRGLDVAAIKLHVNLWPYTFTQDGYDELIDIIKSHVALSTVVELVSHEPKELTPEFLNAAYDAVVFVDFNEWDAIHRQALMDNPMPMMTFFLPKWHTGPIPEPDEVRLEDGAEIEPFKFIGGVFLEYVFISWLPAGAYSCPNPYQATPVRDMEPPPFTPQNDDYSDTNMA